MMTIRGTLSRALWISLLAMFYTDVAFASCKGSMAQHSTDKNKTSKPSLFMYTHSKGEDISDEDKESYAIDAALSLNCAAGGESTSEYMFAIEAHKNDLTAKESDSLSVKTGWSVDLSEQAFLTSSIGYVTDNVKDTESVQVIADMNFLVNELYINNYYLASNWAFIWSPVLALEYEEFIKSEDDKEGSVVRAMVGIGLQFSTFFDSDSEYYRVVFDLNHTHWANINDDSILDLPSSHNLTTFEVKYVLEKTDTLEVSIVYKWNDGEDIRNKIQEQEFDQLGLGFNFTF